MSETLEQVKTLALFPFGLRRFLRPQLTLDNARCVVHDRMKHREENFLQLAKRSIYSHPSSPYLALLKMAGCDYGDLRALVRQKGLEGALSDLRARGVYVTFEEFKGRKPIVRNGKTIPVTPRDFDNPSARHDFASRTSGSTGAATYVGAVFDYLAARAAQTMVGGFELGLSNAPMAIWIPILPGPGLLTLLVLNNGGWRIERWFSSVGWRDSKYWFKYDAATLYMFLCTRANGLRIPFPEIIPVDRASVIAQCVSAK